MIPSKFGLMKNLRYLNLSNAGFVGQIPIDEIALVTKLATLDLSISSTLQHSLKLEKPNIGVPMQNLTEIAELYLDGVMISATGKEWSHALSTLQKLQVLSLSSCNLSGLMDSSLSKLKSLSVIKLNLNNISSPVPESLANLSNLTTLQLSNCALTNVFPKGIFQMQKLKILDVSYNQDLNGSLPNFPQEGYLQTLNLSNTNFSGQLPGTISNLKQLAIVDLSSCQFNATLPVSLLRLSHLVHLDLPFNNFTGHLPSLNTSNKLKYLSLFQNALTGPITSTHWEKLLNLISNNLGDNSFSGKVPPTLFTIPSLRELILSHNGFYDTLDEFPNVSFSNLQSVDLSNNKLQGPKVDIRELVLSLLDFPSALFVYEQQGETKYRSLRRKCR
ncbi:hypothetical protein VNO78_15607 [Psophocarpus tetragonolobus]|uniref:Uncharacterized protein n=1 Tax=Psophocarpus tetragonolobus TaxID=3891 RepID=A0AAN9SGS8_PSOTE